MSLKQHPSMRAARLKKQCPHCKSPGIARTSEILSATVSRIYYQCVNVACGHTWVATLADEVTISPSALPDPTVNLPVSASAKERVTQIQATDPGNPTPSLLPLTPIHELEAPAPSG